MGCLLIVALALAAIISINELLKSGKDAGEPAKRPAASDTENRQKPKAP